MGVPGVDVEKFQKLALNGCYKNGIYYGQDYAKYLLHNYQTLLEEVQQKYEALKKKDLGKMAKGVDLCEQSRLQVSAKMRVLLKLREPLIEYRNSLEKLERCCRRMDVDRNNGNMIGVVNYDTFYQWRRDKFAELAKMEQNAHSPGGLKSFLTGLCCSGYAMGINAKWNALPFVSYKGQKKAAEIEKEFRERLLKETGIDLSKEAEVEDENIDFQITPGIPVKVSKAVYASHNGLRQDLLENGAFLISAQGFDVVQKHLITPDDFRADADWIVKPPKPGVRRVLFAYRLDNSTSKDGELRVRDPHWVMMDESGSWVDKPGVGKVNGPDQSKNPLHIEKFFAPPTDDNAIVSTVSVNGCDTSKTHYMLVAYYEFSDRMLYSRKYAKRAKMRIDEPKKLFLLERRKLIADLTRTYVYDAGLLPLRGTSEYNRGAKQERYQSLGANQAQKDKAYSEKIKDHDKFWEDTYQNYKTVALKEFGGQMGPPSAAKYGQQP